MSITSIKPGKNYAKATYTDHPWMVTNVKGECLGIYAATAEPVRIVLEPSDTQSAISPIQPVPTATAKPAVTTTPPRQPASPTAVSNGKGNYKSVSPAEWMSNATRWMVTSSEPEASQKFSQLLSSVRYPESVLVGSDGTEYATFRTNSNELYYLATRQLRDGTRLVQDLDTSNEILERVKNREPELYGKVINAIASNQSPTSAVQEITGTGNPDANGRVLMHTLDDTYVLYSEKGELIPFVLYYFTISSKGAEFGINANLDAASFYYGMGQLGLDGEIPYTGENLALIAGELIAQNPESTKLSVRIRSDGKNTVIDGDVNRSALVKISERLFYAMQDASKAAESQNYVNTAAGKENPLAHVRRIDTASRGNQESTRAMQELQRQLTGTETPYERSQREQQQRRQLEQLGRDLGKYTKPVEEGVREAVKEVEKQLTAVSETPYEKRQREEQERQQMEQLRKGVEEGGKQLQKDLDKAGEQFGKGWNEAGKQLDQFLKEFGKKK